MNKLIGVAALAVTLPFIAACGDYGAGAEATPTTQPKPTVEYRDRRVNVPVEVTPDACLEAIEIAEEVFALSADVAFAASDGFDAAAHFDVDGIEDAGERITEAGGEVEALTPRWQAARDDCQAAN